MVWSSMWGHNYLFLVDSLGLRVVFRCSVVWSSICGDITTSFCGLLGVDGCIQMFDDDE